MYDKKLQNVADAINKFSDLRELTPQERAVYEGMSPSGDSKYPFFDGLCGGCCSVNVGMQHWEPNSLQERASVQAQQLMHDNGF